MKNWWWVERFSVILGLPFPKTQHVLQWYISPFVSYFWLYLFSGRTDISIVTGKFRINRDTVALCSVNVSSWIKKKTKQDMNPSCATSQPWDFVNLTVLSTNFLTGENEKKKKHTIVVVLIRKKVTFGLGM